MTQFRITILSIIVVAIIRVLRFTWRVRIITEAPMPKEKALVFCFWHGNQAALFGYRQERPIAVLSSLSEDGTLQAGILSRLGYVVCRGSSSRGGAAGLKAMIGQLQRGCDAAFAVDGPRGPFHLAKPGAIKAAWQSGGVIVPVSSVASRAWVLSKSWDRYTLPWPFAKITVRLGRPMPPDLMDVSLLSKLINLPLKTE